MRTLHILPLLFILQDPVSHAQGGRVSDLELAAQEIQALQKEMERLQGEVDPLLVDLENRAKVYASSRDLVKTAQGREAIRRKISELGGEHLELQREFKTKVSGLQQASLLASAKSLVPALLNKSKASQAQQTRFGEKLQALMSGQNAYKPVIRAFNFRVTNIMGQEAEAFDAAYREVLARQKKRLLIGGIAAVLLLGGFSYFLWRRNERLVETIARGRTQPPAGQALVRASGGGEQPGDVIAETYRIEGKIGEGGMGVVFAATDIHLKRKVAIKKMRPELFQAAKELDIMLKEAQVVASLKHPNIVEIHGIHKDAGGVYLIFEFVDGKPLSAWLDSPKALTFDYTRGVMRQIASALDYAHSQKVIHRDLKPANIMIANRGIIKVMDFGIAHQAKQTAARATRTNAWGTPAYMAPEQELGSVSRASDIYALGVCLYEMITCELPFQGPNFLAQKQGMYFKPPSELRDGLPAGIDAVLRKALAADSKARYATAKEFVSALDVV